MKIKILADREDGNRVVNEQAEEWLYTLLHFLGADIEYIKELSDDLVVDYLVKNHLTIYDYPGIGAIRVEYEGETVGEWAGPEFILKKDEEGRLYYEISIETWSIIDEGMDLE